MNPKEVIGDLIEAIAFLALQHINEKTKSSKDGWVPAAEIKRDLNLNFIAVPRANKQHRPKGWLFAILARILEDKGLIEYKKDKSNRAFYRPLTK
ncbi:hypothetical protein Misp06_03605 [Microbulbifer sp. NBRC 101763]|uniref:hypothetical protein n=1 Tax=Microbulbifer sp. NBRC 101763 TaxID=1113820 RepID=UPI00309FC766